MDYLEVVVMEQVRGLWESELKGTSPVSRRVDPALEQVFLRALAM